MKKALKELNNLVTKLKEKNIFLLVFIAIFLYLFFYKLLSYEGLNTYTLTYYVITYANGFISRALTGTIFSLLGLTSKMEVVVANLIVVFSLIVLMSSILNKLVKKYNNSFILLILVFIFNSGSITTMYSYFEFARLDIYIFLMGILSFYLLYKRKLKYIPIVTAVSLLIHEGFVFWIFPIVTMLLLYYYFEEKKSIYLKVCIINFIVAAVLVLTIRLFMMTPAYPNKSEFIRNLQGRTDININVFSVGDYYYTNKEDEIAGWKYVFASQSIIDYSIAVVGYLVLLSLCLITVITKVILKSKHKIWMLLTLASTLSPLIMFVLVCDWGRWYMYLTNGLILLTIYLMFDKYKVLKDTKIKLVTVISCMLLIVISCIFYPPENFHYLSYNHTNRLMTIYNNLISK